MLFYVRPHTKEVPQRNTIVGKAVDFEWKPWEESPRNNTRKGYAPESRLAGKCVKAAGVETGC
jgi:hypothetical protein